VSAPAGREGRGGLGQRTHLADGRVEPPVPHPPHEFGEPGPVGFDDEEDRTAVLRPDLGRLGDGDEGAAGTDECGRAAEDLAADDVEHDIGLSRVLQPLGLEVEEVVGAEGETGVPVGGTAGGDHPCARLARELDRDRSDASRGAVDHDGLPRGEPCVVEQALPRRQSRDGQRGGHGVVDVRGKGRQVAGLHGGVLGQRSVARPVGHAEHALADGEAGGAVSEFRDHPRQFVSGNARRPVPAGPVRPGCGPVEFSAGEARGVHAYDDVVLGGVRMRQFRQGEPGGACRAVVDGDGLHEGSSGGAAVIGHTMPVRARVGSPCVVISTVCR
jgi:hypothetical protein